MSDLIASIVAELTWPLLVRLKIGPVALSPHGIGIAMIAVGLFILLILRRSPSRQPVVADETLENATEEGRTA